jgi:hypothetical protein
MTGEEARWAGLGPEDAEPAEREMADYFAFGGLTVVAEPQAGAQVPIPDDLKELYELSKRAKLAGREMVYCGLIERIGRLEIALRLVLMKSIDFQNSFCRLCGTKDRHADDCVSHVANTALMEK